MLRKVAETNNFLQRMMRGRIAAQGFTIMALLTGIMVSVKNINLQYYPFTFPFYDIRLMSSAL